MLKTIFSDNKLTEFPSIEYSNNLQGSTLTFKQTKSVSPQKAKQSKKFFYSMRNKSIRHFQDTPSAQHELETLLRKEKIVLTAQRTTINDLLLPNLLPNNLSSKEVELMILPSIEVKRITEAATTNLKRVEKRKLMDMIDFKADYSSNIFGNSNPNANHNPINYRSKDNPQERQLKNQTKCSITIPKINNKRASSQFQKNQLSPQQDSPIKVNNDSPIKPNYESPIKLSQVKSTDKFDARSSYQKKFKKGFLSYEPHGNELWSRIKEGTKKQPQLKAQQAGKGVSAKRFYAYDLQLHEPVVGYNQNQQIQIASLSKIMTCYLSILICKKYDVDIKAALYRVPDRIPQTPGTSAQLQAGDLVSVQDLLYGLMLPSGNDASICLAEAMGKVIQRHKKKEQRRSYFETFLAHMNAFSKELDLPQQWNNSSGLPANPNFSTAQAIVALSALAISNPLFSSIVSTREVSVDIKNDRYGLTGRKIWRNTNKLLEKGWEGVKTGTTETAGHCLISKRKNLLLGVFDCQTMNKRFTDSVHLSTHIVKLTEKS